MSLRKFGNRKGIFGYLFGIKLDFPAIWVSQNTFMVSDEIFRKPKRYSRIPFKVSNHLSGYMGFRMGLGFLGDRFFLDCSQSMTGDSSFSSLVISFVLNKWKNKGEILPKPLHKHLTKAEAEEKCIVSSL